MRPHYKYERLHRSAATRLIWLHGKVSTLNPSLSQLHDETIAFVTVEALNIWSSFVRAYYLSWFLRPKTMAGQRVTCSHHFVLFQDALIFSVQLLRPRRFSGGRVSRRDEPTWHDPANLLSLARAVGVSNLSQISSALSFGATYADNLPTVRNFYAHRNEETFSKVQRQAALLGMGTDLRPCEFVCAALPSRPQNLISDWLDEMRLTIELLCI